MINSRNKARQHNFHSCPW